MKNRQLSIVTTLLLLSSHFIHAEDGDGSCEGYKFPLQRDGKSINTSLPLRVLRDNVPVYYNERGSDKKTTLQFGEVLDALSISDSKTSGRIQICKSGCLPDEPLGWMDRQDLLCKIHPLKNKEGLERKAFIKTPPQPEIVEQGRIRVKKTNVTAYSCYNDSCKTSKNSLSRFEMYFIFAEKQQRYLLSDKYNISQTPPLIGWVDKDKILMWNTSLQLRPKEAVDYIRAYPEQKNYRNRAVKINPRAAIDLAGGNTWYKFPLHVPLLEKPTDKGREYYHVSAPGIGMKGFDVENMNQQTELVEQLKQIDVFFLLDGTRSMQPSLDAAKNFSRKIVNDLSNKHDYRETHFRFGFRVYRDNFKGSRWAGDESIGEGLPLSGTCKAKANITKKNQKKFNYKISNVQESDERSNEDSSYTENLFKGLRQAVKDMSNCPNRVKILFVIGDHGDNKKSIPNSVYRRLTQTFTKSVRLFFIQTPNEKPYNNEYQTAYKRFQTQANSLLKKVYPGMNYRDNLKTLEQATGNQIIAQLQTMIVQQVSNFSPSSAINEIILKLRAGQSVKNIIEQGMREGDLPILYWQILEKDLCQAANKQCKDSVDHRVIDAYIPVSNKLVEEIWISSRELNNWKSVLRPLFNEANTRKRLNEQKRDFLRTLKEETQLILGYPEIAQASEVEILGDILKRINGLPVREHSPLMQYSKREILDMPQCEFHRLTKWIKDIFDLLTRLTANPTYKVAYSLDPYPESQCRGISDKGKNIQRLRLKPPKPLGPSDEYRYDHSFRKQTIYSIPKDFLP
jgi:hypothetical protein